ncbi:fructosamine kinase family protein [Aestuariirhabdus litorea]|uniref:Fructosamine kinase family protein n=1 Tax=Aestuariirhabdus litorea TaxID=2528527 RepID=A0A3P3VJD4_9GAMM|nr:fructosamine kinase family protein [Aestuariirhabdus litorea]RRJ82474.1 fructosamine kinase family protein [Aestuariirhabdus litorea]RWW92635.1 fructosamine kinase family protein [Endozoicomonadaceae bacterium GTF-13]
MLTTAQLRTLEEWLSQSWGERAHIRSVVSVNGGDINQAWRLEGTPGTAFLKTNRDRDNRNFDTEAGSLEALGACGAVRVPSVLHCQRWQGENYLLLEYLALRPGNGEVLGRALARLHRQAIHEHYGWPEDNFIGLTPQLNRWSQNWAEFYARCRIGPQLVLANQRGAGLGDPEGWIKRVENRLAGHQPEASLLHGDLWSGNASLTREGHPVLFDPASYYGDRETDLAMSRLFGGFSESFYRAYQEQWPLAPDYTEREPLYQLYHVLNHFNLFGGHYRAQAQRILQRLA